MDILELAKEAEAYGRLLAHTSEHGDEFDFDTLDVEINKIASIAEDDEVEYMLGRIAGAAYAEEQEKIASAAKAGMGLVGKVGLVAAGALGGGAGVVGANAMLRKRRDDIAVENLKQQNPGFRAYMASGDPRQVAIGRQAARHYAGLRQLARGSQPGLAGSR